MASARTVSLRYAKALFSLAEAAGHVEAVAGELDRVLEVADNHAEFDQVLSRPLHPASERRAVLAAVGRELSLSPIVANFCQFLIDQRRSQELRTIREEYVRLAEEAAGRVRGEVVSAAPLSDAQLDALRRSLSARTGRSVDLDVRVDPELLGGVVARVGDLMFDGSLRSRLEGLRSDLLGR